MAEEGNSGRTQVVINVSGEEIPKGSPNKASTESSAVTAGPTANKPPKAPIAGNEPLLRRRSFAKPKSRFGEQSYVPESDKMEDNNLAYQEQDGGNSPYRLSSINKASPCNKSARSIRTDSAMSKTLSMASRGSAREDENEEIIKKVELQKEKLNGVKPKINFLLRKKVLYFVHGLKKSVQVFIWLSIVLVTWVLLFLDVERSKTATKVLNHVTWTLVSIVVGAFLWLLKTLLLKILASNFHMNKFFDRIQESIFHHYVLRTLSGPPLLEVDGIQKPPAQLIVSNAKKGFPQSPNTLEESACDEGGEQADNEITNEEEALYVAHQVFAHVARHDSNQNRNYIDEDDLLRFMIKEEVDLVFPLFEGSSTGKIDRKSFTNWVIKVYQDRKTLGHALSDTKTAVKQLNALVTAILIVITITIFEAIIFVFVMHPFDVGDRCVVDGVQLLVEEMNILTTVFLKLDNEKVYYPNSVLATKPISNYYRSPDMSDTIEFSIDFMTPARTIGMLKEEEIKK
ncbi:hypothetical protein GQ457_07G039070 [Hibiscus cannabinus]